MSSHYFLNCADKKIPFTFLYTEKILPLYFYALAARWKCSLSLPIFLLSKKRLPFLGSSTVFVCAVFMSVYILFSMGCGFSGLTRIFSFSCQNLRPYYTIYYNCNFFDMI